jgi:hypothetical protein
VLRDVAGATGHFVRRGFADRVAQACRPALSAVDRNMNTISWRDEVIVVSAERMPTKTGAAAICRS